MNEHCPQCDGENAEYVTELTDNGEKSVWIIVCQCSDCGEEKILYPEFPDYSGF